MKQAAWHSPSELLGRRQTPVKMGVRAHDYGKLPIGELCREIAGDGWNAIQLAIPKAVAGLTDFSDVTADIVHEIRVELEKSGLSVAVLGVYVEPSLMDDTQRLAQTDHLFKALSQAKILNAGCVGTETTSRKRQPGASHKDALRQLYRSLESLLPEAERLGVNIAVEPVYRHTLNSPELTRGLLKDMNSPRLKVIFDPVNLMQLEDIGTQAGLWQRCMDCFGGDIVAVHIKGASGEMTELGLGNAALADSVVDYKSLFGHLRALNAPILREAAVPACAGADIAFIRRLMNNPEG